MFELYIEAQRNKTRENMRISSRIFLWSLILICLHVGLINAAPQGNLYTDEIHQERKEQKLIDELEEITKELKIYEEIVDNFLKPVNKIINLEKTIEKLSDVSTDNHNDITKIKSKLSIDTKDVTTSLDRQEGVLGDLQSKTTDLQKKWQDQQSELLQLKNKWSDLGVKVESSATDAKKLRESSQDINKNLEEQHRKVTDQEITAERLESLLKDAEQSVMDLKKDVEDIFNNQERLETQLEDVKLQIRNIPVGKPVPADDLCRRFRLT